MGFVVDLELMIEDKALRLVANTEFFGLGTAVIGIFDKDPVLPRLPDKFMMFKFWGSEFYVFFIVKGIYSERNRS